MGIKLNLFLFCVYKSKFCPDLRKFNMALRPPLLEVVYCIMHTVLCPPCYVHSALCTVYSVTSFITSQPQARSLPVLGCNDQGRTHVLLHSTTTQLNCTKHKFRTQIYTLILTADESKLWIQTLHNPLHVL